MITLLLALTAFAHEPPKQYHIALQYFEDERLVNSPRMVINDDSAATTSDKSEDGKNGNTLRVHVKGVGKNQVLVKVDVDRMRDGKSTMLGRMQVIALEGEEAAMEISDRRKETGAVFESRKLTVVVTPQ